MTPIDPHLLGNRVFEIDAKDNSGLYSAVEPSVVAANDGELVLAWQDLSIIGLKSPHQTTSGLRGIAREFPYGWGVEFDGVDNQYIIDDGGIPGSVFSSCTLYSVLTVDSTSSCTVFSCTTAGGGAFQDRYDNPMILKNDVEVVGSGSTPPTVGERFVDAMTYDGSTLSFYRNGLPNGSITVSKSFATASNQLGCTVFGFEFFEGLMHYRSVFNAVHDSATIAGVTSFLKQRWGV